MENCFFATETCDWEFQLPVAFFFAKFFCQRLLGVTVVLSAIEKFAVFRMFRSHNRIVLLHQISKENENESSESNESSIRVIDSTIGRRPSVRAIRGQKKSRANHLIINLSDVSEESLASETGTNLNTPSSQNSQSMEIKIQINEERITNVDGMMTFGKTDNGQHVLDFKATEQVEMPAFKAPCFVQGMTDGNVYITETAALSAGKRNPHVFIGKYITVTRRDDGSLRLNFRPVTMGADFNIYRYATGVFSELIRALRGLVGKEASK